MRGETKSVKTFVFIVLILFIVCYLSRLSLTSTAQDKQVKHLVFYILNLSHSHIGFSFGFYTNIYD